MERGVYFESQKNLPPYIIVSDRKLRTVLSLLRIERSEIQPNDLVLHSGSGFSFLLERELSLRGVQTAVIDQSLACRPSEYPIYLDPAGFYNYIKQGTPIPFRPRETIQGTDAEIMQQRRQKFVQELCQIVLACTVPNPAMLSYIEGVAWLLDSFGPGAYIADFFQLQGYLETAVAVLKRKGQARFFPIIEKQLPFWQAILNSIPGIDSKFFIENDVAAGGLVFGAKVEKK